MKKITLFLIPLLFFISLTSFSLSGNYTPTPKQAEFLSNVLVMQRGGAILDAKWVSPDLFWFEFSLSSLSYYHKKDAQAMADMIADMGKTILEQPLCAQAYNKDLNTTATSCVK